MIDAICLYLITGIIVLEMVRPAGEKVPPGGLLRSVIFWPFVVVVAALYIWSHHRSTR